MQRIHWSVRLGAFALSTFTLSLFFAGWREINTTAHWSGWALLSGGTILTLLLLFLQGYWIYFEEKNKGALRRSSRIFEALHEFLERWCGHSKVIRMIQPVAALNQQNQLNQQEVRSDR